MTNINITSLRFKEKHITCQQLFDHRKIKGIAQCNDNHRIKLNILEITLVYFSLLQFYVSTNFALKYMSINF